MIRRLSYCGIQHSSLTIRKKIYLFFIIAGMIQIFFPFVAHADLFGYEIQDVYVQITENVEDINQILKEAFSFSQESPFTLINRVSFVMTGQILRSVTTACKTTSLVVATLLLMVDFYKKSINFEWSSKWENILLFLIKIIIVKQIVMNADVIISYIYAGFNYINEKAITTDIEFLPCGNTVTYHAFVEEHLLEQFSKGWWDFWYERGSGENIHEFTYIISQDAVGMFYPNAEFYEDGYDLSNVNLPNPTTSMNFFPTLQMLYWQPYFLVMKAIAYFIFVIVVGRVFELTIYTIFAPLPLATFASDTSHEVAKNFIKNYIATVIQIAVIVVMFLSYSAINIYIGDYFEDSKWMQIAMLIALGTGVIKSGSWSKKICGVG